MSAQTPGRGVAGVEPREGHPGPAGGETPKRRLSMAVAPFYGRGSAGVTEDPQWADTLFEQRDAALATIERVRALLQARAETCPGAEFIAIADIKAALTGGLGRRAAS